MSNHSYVTFVTPPPDLPTHTHTHTPNMLTTPNKKLLSTPNKQLLGATNTTRTQRTFVRMATEHLFWVQVFFGGLFYIPAPTRPIFARVIARRCARPRPRVIAPAYMTATGGVPKHPTAYIDITFHLDVWFLLLTESGGLVCFVTVGGGCLFSGVYDYV